MPWAVQRDGAGQRLAERSPLSTTVSLGALARPAPSFDSRPLERHWEPVLHAPYLLHQVAGPTFHGQHIPLLPVRDPTVVVKIIREVGDLLAGGVVPAIEPVLRD